MVLLSTWMLLVANSTPMVLLLSRLNSLRVKRESRLLFPTPESPMSTTRGAQAQCQSPWTPNKGICILQCRSSQQTPQPSLAGVGDLPICPLPRPHVHFNQ